ncbi:hypothetical protein Hypma_004523 [Hypsizygus marmoreus]|uniref:F-box domain-containing protein n=1 Tax=Hypsizygus marmoreus TaxID=39966 RepID=A0A369K3N4_HYPMA|nr:hypothetical protein Hypma_004523 [Hypsizygus marmoreus]
MHATLSGLPTEIIDEIVRNLLKFSDLQSICRASKRLNGLETRNEACGMQIGPGLGQYYDGVETAGGPFTRIAPPTHQELWLPQLLDGGCPEEFYPVTKVFEPSRCELSDLDEEFGRVCQWGKLSATLNSCNLPSGTHWVWLENHNAWIPEASGLHSNIKAEWTMLAALQRQFPDEIFRYAR